MGFNTHWDTLTMMELGMTEKTANKIIKEITMKAWKQYKNDARLR